MTNIGFPPNPEDGEIYQVNDEIIYQYDASKKCWNRISGIDNIELATVSEAGLMSKEDFIKIEEILLPSFNTTLTSDQCDSTFNEGRVELVSTDSSVEIAEKLKLFNPDGTFEENDFIIHNNTVGIDFRINIPQLIQELKDRDSFSIKEISGDPGDQGDKGDQGEDRVDTGPIGSDGAAGANAPYEGSLTEDLNANLATNKAVVDVVNDEDNPNIIRVTIGNIGSPGVGPKTLSWKDKNSSWILGLSDQAFNCNIPQECSPTGQILYIDVQPMLDKLNDRAEQILGEIRTEKEELASSFTQNLSSVFSQQRQAVCCAIESVVSRKVNQNIRDTWSQGKYQAAQAGYAFTVSDDIVDPQPRTDPQQTPEDFVPKPPVGDPNQNIIINGDLDISPVQFGCQSCYIQVTLDRTNLGPDRSVKIDLPAFDYISTITGCCVFYEGVGGTGVFNVSYVGDDDERKIARLNDRGVFLAGEDVEAYTGDSLSFRHHGGTVEFYLNAIPSFGAGGTVVLCVQPSTCFQTDACINPNPIECDSDFFVIGQDPGKSLVHLLGDSPSSVTLIFDFFTKRSTLNVYHPAVEDPANLLDSTGSVLGTGSLIFPYGDIENKGDQVLVVVTTDEVGAEFTYALGCNSDITNAQIPTSSSMLAISHAEFYERGWRSSNCCGVHVDLGGSEFIVVFRSIGSDCSCGGNEYTNTPFIENFSDITGFQPALAWPTVDGETFFGLPRGEDAFIEVTLDKTISDLLLEKIQAGDFIKAVGDPSVIHSIVLPVI